VSDGGLRRVCPVAANEYVEPGEASIFDEGLPILRPTPRNDVW
jgi:hypothetical protein